MVSELFKCHQYCKMLHVIVTIEGEPNSCCKFQKRLNVTR